MHHLLEQLEEDHRRMLRIMYLLNREVDMLSGMTPGRGNCDQLLDILDYIQTYPEVWHHPTEDLLFQHLLGKPLVNSAPIEALLREHIRLEALSAQIALLLGESKARGIVPPPRVLCVLRQYYAEQLSHIQSERQVFELIERLFEASDWQHIHTLTRLRLRDPERQALHDDCLRRCEPLSMHHPLTSIGLH